MQVEIKRLTVKCESTVGDELGGRRKKTNEQREFEREVTDFKRTL